MHLIGERRSFHNWPKVKAHGADGYRITGYCPTVLGSRALRRLSFIALTVIGVVLLASATMGVWAPAAFEATEGTSGFLALKRLASVQWFFRDLLTERFPTIGKAIGYGGRTDIDWYMAVLAVICLGGRRLWAKLLSDTLGLVLTPVTAKRIRITITPDRVRLGGWIFGKTLKRDDNGPNPIRFRVAGAEEYFAQITKQDGDPRNPRQPLSSVPPAVVELVHGLRRYKVVFAHREDRAEAIVARCQEVMRQTQPLIDHPIT